MPCVGCPVASPGDFDDAPEVQADLSGLLAQVRDLLCAYIAFFSDAQATACALWTAHTYVVEQADCSPYLSITSAEKRSGKSRLLNLLELLVKSPWQAVSPTAATVYRTIEAVEPTLLLDEVDAIFGSRSETNEALRAVLNAGHRKGQWVPRCEPPKFDVKKYNVFCPKALAGIGDLPDTVADRSISIRLKRRAPAEHVRRWRHREVEEDAIPIRDGLAEWAESADLREARPELPNELNDRAMDGWEPLLAIADAAGGQWPGWARAAAVELDGDTEVAEASWGIRLLTDLAEIFAGRSDDAIPSRELLEILNDLDESPWGGFRDSRGLDGRGLAHKLRPYDIRPTTFRDGAGTHKGYRREHLADAFTRYLESER